MRTKSLLIGSVVIAALAGALSGRMPPRALAEPACRPNARSTDAVGAPVAVDHDRLVAGASVVPSVADVARAPSMLRHVATGDAGVAYVRDQVGADEVVISTDRGTTVVRQRGEVFHPAWSRRGALAWGLDDRLVIRSASGAVRSIRGPRPGGLLVAPVFDGNDVIAVVSAAATRAVPEDEWSNDLWRYRPTRDAWERLTTFGAGSDAWTAIRTPIAAPDGSILFVVIRGRGSASGLPRFALWRLRDDDAHRVRALDDERYLAGFGTSGDLLWNVPDRASATWLIQVDAPSGAVTVGCGAVAVDPMDEPDPDRTGHESRVAASRSTPQVPGDPIEPALLVGDFASELAAGLVAGQLARAYAGALPVDVIRGGAGSVTVQPGRWAVVVRLPATTDGARELSALRAVFPALSEHSWIVVL